MQFFESGGGAAGLPFSTATRHGNLIYVSGQVAQDNTTKEFVTGDFEKEARLTLDNVKHAIEVGGGNLDNVLKVMVYLTDAALFADFNRVYRSYFSPDHLPARTTVIVAALADPRLRIEIDAVAVIDRGGFIPL